MARDLATPYSGVQPALAAFARRLPGSTSPAIGYFQQYEPLPELIAWEAFGEANGAATFEVMKERVDRIRARNQMESASGLQQIGCIVLANPVFFPREYWIPQPKDWPPRNLRPMRYDLEVGEGKRVWDECLPLSVLLAPEQPAVAVGESRWGEPVLAVDRRLLIVPEVRVELLDKWSIDESVDVGEFNRNQQAFLDHHRVNVFNRHRP